MIYGYARVFTKNNDSLLEQEAELKNAGAEVIYTDLSDGERNSTPEFDKLMSVISPGDSLVVTSMDRIVTSIKLGGELIKQLADKGVAVNILNLGVFDDSPAGKLRRSILLSFSNMEENLSESSDL